jgi:hypothetical protein
MNPYIPGKLYTRDGRSLLNFIANCRKNAREKKTGRLWTNSSCRSRPRGWAAGKISCCIYTLIAYPQDHMNGVSFSCLYPNMKGMGSWVQQYIKPHHKDLSKETLIYHRGMRSHTDITKASKHWQKNLQIGRISPHGRLQNLMWKSMKNCRGRWSCRLQAF